MITTSELLQLMSLLISVAGLFYLIGKDNNGRKKIAVPGYFFFFTAVSKHQYLPLLQSVPLLLRRCCRSHTPHQKPLSISHST